MPICVGNNRHTIGVVSGRSRPRPFLQKSPISSEVLRLADDSPSQRPFLLSPGAAWAAVDFATAFSLAALLQMRDWTPYSATAGSAHPHGILASALAGLPFTLFVMITSRLSGLHKTGVARTIAAQLRRIALSVALAFFGLCGLQKLWGGTAAQLHEPVVLEAVLIGAVMFLSRVLWQRYRRLFSQRNAEPRKILIVGANQVGRDVRDYLMSLPYASYSFRGFISLGEIDGDETGGREDEIVGDIDNLIFHARSRFVDEIIFTRRPFTPGVLSHALQQSRSVGIDLRLIPSLSETLNNRADVQYIGNLPTIAIFQNRHRTLSLFLKRAIDIVCAAFASVVLLPVFLAIAFTIKLYSPGPVFYLSKRVGYRGRVFTCFKFRTMVKGAASMQAQIAHLNERKGILFKITKDPRVTGLGAILRKYSLDELPQLWNVLLGDMSLVGPRPSISSEVAQYKTPHLRRLDVVPGMTGLWQVEARHDPSFESYIKLDSEYVNGWSLWLDLKILLRTVSAVIAGTGS
jgi:exopolysaccharide biosynthesis polyprenyl glycosylphosphotransferase